VKVRKVAEVRSNTVHIKVAKKTQKQKYRGRRKYRRRGKYRKIGKHRGREK
jgi:hypothetical protein